MESENDPPYINNELSILPFSPVFTVKSFQLLAFFYYRITACFDFFIDTRALPLQTGFLMDGLRPSSWITLDIQIVNAVRYLDFLCYFVLYANCVLLGKSKPKQKAKAK